MARSRGFDTDAAVEQAMDLFWKQGYRATPMPRLTELLGIGSGSLYAAFGSKDGLYAQALRRYCEGLVAALDRDVRAGDDIRTALRRLLLAMVTADAADPERGCLLVNAIVERAAHDGTVQQVRTAMTAIEAVLAEALERARVRGELSGERSPVEVARFLTTFIQGLHVMSQARADRAFLEPAVAVALRVLD
ncbi:TetR family transcriptional regulator [Streptomyces olivaceoviridis]|uniref:TetR/AcrR family transcriptional regulator n=1 Tax=Streptomyces olivaceoviridis TaxID=1921 RepID=UPI0019A8CA92|nr:TetR/AcrR family transcriptional regulator [Streptomyces olivaceoviridis]GGZ30610.1 TetR family transcriptional regulator [Streptomyces olivaceoviridis]